jgi:hypothetical protein
MHSPARREFFADHVGCGLKRYGVRKELQGPNHEVLCGGTDVLAALKRGADVPSGL